MARHQEHWITALVFSKRSASHRCVPRIETHFSRSRQRPHNQPHRIPRCNRLDSVLLSLDGFLFNELEARVLPGSPL